MYLPSVWSWVPAIRPKWLGWFLTLISLRGHIGCWNFSTLSETRSDIFCMGSLIFLFISLALSSSALRATFDFIWLFSPNSFLPHHGTAFLHCSSLKHAVFQTSGKIWFWSTLRIQSCTMNAILRVEYVGRRKKTEIQSGIQKKVKIGEFASLEGTKEICFDIVWKETYI